MAETGSATRDAAEQVRSILRGLVKLLLWVVPLIALIYVGFLFFKPSGPGTEDRPENTLRSYIDLVQPYASNPSRTPGVEEFKLWIQYFDSDSRDFFEHNFTRMVRKSLAGDMGEMAQAKLDTLRLEAMAYAITIPPLNGLFVVKKQTQRADGTGVDVIVSLTKRDHSLFMKQEGGRWRIAEMGGVKELLVKQKQAQ